MRRADGSHSLQAHTSTERFGLPNMCDLLAMIPAPRKPDILLSTRERDK